MSLNTDLSAFAEHGHAKIKIENMASYRIFETAIKNTFSKSKTLNHIHNHYLSNQLNDYRMRSFREINLIKNW